MIRFRLTPQDRDAEVSRYIVEDLRAKSRGVVGEITVFPDFVTVYVGENKQHVDLIACIDAEKPLGIQLNNLWTIGTTLIGASC